MQQCSCSKFNNGYRAKKIGPRCCSAYQHNASNYCVVYHVFLDFQSVRPFTLYRLDWRPVTKLSMDTSCCYGVCGLGEYLWHVRLLACLRVVLCKSSSTTCKNRCVTCNMSPFAMQSCLSVCLTDWLYVCLKTRRRMTRLNNYFNGENSTEIPATAIKTSQKWHPRHVQG